VSALVEIAAIVAEKHGLTIDDLRGPARERKVAWPRQEAFALTYSTGRFSTTRIGQFYRRDHTTVIDGIRHYQGRLQAAQEVRP
jgi:chromosomal replication initiation ATPase DnaA